MMQHKGEYSSLALASAVYIYLVYHYQNVPQYIVITTAAFALLYVLWGIYHHTQRHNLHLRIVLEYLLVAILGVAIVTTLLL